MTLLQDSTDSPEVQDERDTPKFYKRDLITVLRERNELKEELDSLRDELAMAKALVNHCSVILLRTRNMGGDTLGPWLGVYCYVT